MNRSHYTRFPGGLVVTLAALLGLAGALALPMLLGRAVSRHSPGQQAAWAASQDADPVYLPLLASSRVIRRVNIPYFPLSHAPEVTTGIVFTETAVFWFGRITSAENYADVRVAYDDRLLYVHVAIYDRLLWYQNSQPTPANLLQRDSASLYLNLTGSSGSAPLQTSYRFDAGLRHWENRAAYQVAYQGNGSAWQQVAAVFTTTVGASWESGTVGGFNNGENNRGWVVVYRVPFSSLGLAGPPAPGSLWGAALAVHDGESASGVPLADKTWPETMNAGRPSSWGGFHFGLSAGGAQPGAPDGTTTIRQGLNGIVVPDGGVGGNLPARGDGSALCPGDPAIIWNSWATRAFPGSDSVNIQNQALLADWPCFAKYLVTFPLASQPGGKTILSAELTLHQWGGSDLAHAQPSLLQVSTLTEDWSETSLSWNSAPLAAENVSQVWADPYTIVNPQDWPGQPVTWDVTRAVILALASRQPLRLVVYSADAAMHSGKYFITSDDAFYVNGRPTLTIKWANP